LGAAAMLDGCAAAANAAPEFETNCLRFILVWNPAAEGLYQNLLLGSRFALPKLDGTSRMHRRTHEADFSSSSERFGGSGWITPHPMVFARTTVPHGTKLCRHELRCVRRFVTINSSYFKQFEK